MTGLKINKRKDSFQLPPIVENYFDFCVWLLQKISKFSKDQRYLLGSRIENLSLTILESLIEGALHKKGLKKMTLLEDVKMKLEQLRYLLRLAMAIRAINKRSHHYGSRRLQEVGTMVGGWIKSMRQRNLSYEL